MTDKSQTFWIVMGGDQPAGVFDSEVKADRWIDQTRKVERAERVRGNRPAGPGIYWRALPFQLNAGEVE